MWLYRTVLKNRRVKLGMSSVCLSSPNHRFVCLFVESHLTFERSPMVRCCIESGGTIILYLLIVFLSSLSNAFILKPRNDRSFDTSMRAPSAIPPPLFAKLSKSRRDQLGVADDEDEYDLSVALERNTDPFITKVIAGSLIMAILAGLVFGVVIPISTDYGDLCNPLLSAGRC
jgi:hypothetical protein